ncbi:VanZ family protein [Crocinitomicaceae bacterium]|nr:VanZ family protein [Crocinitomicaceae bacterium]MDC0257564.1 VanZ family protein [Crocinitomicaceae bacterium]
MKFGFKLLIQLSLIGVIIGIAYLSLSPSPKLTASNDKLGHFIAYGTLMFHLGLLTANNRKSLLISAVFAFVYGGLMEFGQYFVPGRSVSGLDLLANTGGVLIGYLFTLVLAKPIRKLLKVR